MGFNRIRITFNAFFPRPGQGVGMKAAGKDGDIGTKEVIRGREVINGAMEE